MANISTAERAPILIDGVHINADTPVQSTDTGILTIVSVGGKAYASGVTAGTATLVASYGGRSGSLSVTVTEAPLVITLGTAEPE